MRNVKIVYITLSLFVSGSFAQKAEYLREIKAAAEQGWKEYPALIDNWKKTDKPSVLWGYNAPGQPVYLAAVLGFLYDHTHEKEYAQRAAQLLSEYSDLRQHYPADYWKSRPEYVKGIPAISNFFYVAPYVRSYLWIKNSGAIDPAKKQKIEKDIEQTADFVFYFPEWGAHNRAMLRAEALTYAYLALPDHPHAAQWRQMAEVIASDSKGKWEIEDATVYHPVWLYSLLTYADITRQPELVSSPVMHYYMDYFTQLVAPDGRIPDFGDANYYSCWESLRNIPIFEKGAAVYHNPYYKWAAQTLYQSAIKAGQRSPSGAYSLCDAYRWADEKIKPLPPPDLSREVLDDVIGKKVVFRNGRTPASTYLLLNYRDEGEGGFIDREFLRNTISVEEEKMTHGHADENSIVHLQAGGSLLLHDAGYRDGLPSGDYGANRADYFHNRLVARKNKVDKKQTLFEFLHNSGAYRSVVTQKIDFVNLNRSEMSRTRLRDENLGYEWDRSIVHLQQQDWFIVIDAIKILRADYYTFANLWHAQSLLAQGANYYDVCYDSIQQNKLPANKSLLIYFLPAQGKTIGSEAIRRHYQNEQAFYQTISSQYPVGRYETFVTILIPHDRAVAAADLLPAIERLQNIPAEQAVALKIRQDSNYEIIAVKTDLQKEIATANVRPRYLFDLGKVNYGDWETDAHFFHGLYEPGKVEYSATEVLKVIYKQQPLMEALANMHGLQLDGAADRFGFVKWRCWQDSKKVE
jgi:hypothetical protein